MKKNNKIILRKVLYDFDFNIYYLFKKKIFKKKDMITFIKSIKSFQFLKSFILLNIYQCNDYLDLYIYKYNILKVFWSYFLLLHKSIYKNKVKLLISDFFKCYLIKILVNNLFFNYKNKRFSLLLKEVKLNKVLKHVHINIKMNVTKIFKKINKNLKIYLSSFFFNYYKKKLLAMIIKYLYSFYDFKIKKEFVFFWVRFYIYSLKRIYKAANYILKYYIKYIHLQYKLFLSLISFKEKKIKKNIFFFIFFFNKKRSLYLKTFIINRIYGQIFNFNFKNFNIYKKNYFNLFLFNLNVKEIYNNKILKLNKMVYLLRLFIKARFFFNLNNFFFLLILNFLIIWLNYFLIIKNNELIKVFDLNYLFHKANNNYIFNKLFLFIKDRLKGKNFFKCNYFFYNNITKLLV